MSRREEYEKRAEELLAPIVEQNEFELVDVEYVKEAGNWYLRGYIDKPGGIMCDRAHLAAESIKKNHMAQIAVYDDTHRKKLIQEQMIINELGDALKEKQFKAFFQPKYDMRTDRIIGAEALVRCRNYKIHKNNAEKCRSLQCLLLIKNVGRIAKYV